MVNEMEDSFCFVLVGSFILVFWKGAERGPGLKPFPLVFLALY